MFQPILVQRILDAFPIARLALNDAQGLPQALPFVFVRIGQSLWSPVDGKPKRHARLSRLDWIVERPEVCVLIDHYDENWSRLWWLKLFCRGKICHGDHADWQLAVTGLTDKYPQYATTPVFSGEPTMVRFDYHSWKSWAAAGDEAFAERFNPAGANVRSD
jgi:PPOX class probable F420-dependent enzyme